MAGYPARRKPDAGKAIHANIPCGRTRSGPIFKAGTDVKPMDKPTTERTKKAAKEPVKEPAKEAAQIGSIEIEAFAHNIARLVEEGGKKPAAPLWPPQDTTH